MTCILNIEVDDILSRTMEIALENKGYKVISAFTVNEALNKLKNTRPDMILLDIMVSNKDVWKILEKIKEHEALASIPIIIFTFIEPTIDTLKKKKNLGFPEYIIKPFDLDELYSKIELALPSG